MATLNWSTLVSGTYAFDPNVDVLHFDDPAISAAAVDASSTTGTDDLVLDDGSKSVRLLTSALAITTTNVTFANGSRLIIGDNTTGTANDHGANTLNGGSGNDMLIGAAGADTMNGGDGNDVFSIEHDYGATQAYGNATLNGGAGVDRLFYNVTNGWAVNVDLAAGRATGGDGSPAGGSSVLTLNSIEWVDGTAQADTFTGSGAAEIFRGFGGNDTIDGAGGTDIAMFTGTRAQYTVAAQTDGSVRVTDLRSGTPDGIDTLRNVETLRFSDQDMAAPTGGGSTNQPPVVAANGATQTVAANAAVAASSLFTASDPNGNGTITRYDFTDSGSGGGFFRVGTTAQAAGTTFSVTAAQLGSVTYVGGTGAGSETVSVRAFDGTALSNTASWTMQTQASTGGGGGTTPNQAPVVTANGNPQTVGANAAVGASTLFTATDANGNGTITQYQFNDARGGGGFFRVGTTAQAAGTPFTVSAAQLGTVSYVGGSSAGSEDIYVRASDGTAWSGWTGFYMNTQAAAGGGGGGTTPNQAPSVTANGNPQTVGANAAVAASTLFTAADPNGNATITQYQFNDVRGGGGFFRVGTTAQAAGTPFTVSAAQLSTVSYVGGSSAGSEDIYVRASDGTAWSGWTGWYMNTQAGAGGGGTSNQPPVVTATGDPQTVRANTAVAASTLFTAADPNGNATITSYEFNDVRAGGGFFRVGTTAQAAGTPFTVSAAQLSTVSYVGGSSAGSEDVYVRASDGTAVSQWKGWYMNTTLAG